MRIVMLSKACVVGAYQRKLEELAKQPEMVLTVLVPPSWRDSRGEQVLERAYTEGYTLQETPVAFNGRFHLHYYPRLGEELDRLQPDLLHIDEEPYNFATRHAMGHARRLGIPACFFTWQNLNRRYPLLIRAWERFNFAQAAYAIAGNHAATQVLRAKGYTGPLTVIPQFGIDPELFTPLALPPLGARPFTIGYAGGLVPEKGLDTLLRACAGLEGEWRLHLAGSGSQLGELQTLARELGIDERVTWQAKIPSTQMPGFYQELDTFVLPSRTRPNWMEQFGRVLVEAMACAVPVVGSESGEIPFVVGDAGLLFPEGSAKALTAHLQQLRQDPALRTTLAVAGRARVLEHFTQERIARETYAVYRQIREDRSAATSRRSQG